MLAKTDVLDFQLAAPGGGVELVLGVEAGEWNAPEAEQWLKEKADMYARYALDSEMHQRFPESKGKPVSITVVSVDPVPPLPEVD